MKKTDTSKEEALAEQLINIVFKKLKPIIEFYGRIPLGEKTYVEVKIKKPIHIGKDLLLPTGENYFIDKKDLSIGELVDSGVKNIVVPLKIKTPTKNKPQPLNIPTLVSIIKKFNSQLLDLETVKEIETIEKAATELANLQDIASDETEILSTLPLTSSLPNKHIMPNNKLTNTLTYDIVKDSFDIGELELNVAQKNKPEIITTFALSYEGNNVKLSSRHPFTEYDRSVADAIASLWEYGNSNHIVTPAIVYREMTHYTETQDPSHQAIGAVTRSLDKMRFIRVQIDCTEELKKRNIKSNGDPITKGKVDTYLLALEVIEVTAGGKKIKAYRIINKPILYSYSQITGQVYTLSAELLDIYEIDNTGKRLAKIANTDRRIAIKAYLLRQIQAIKSKKNKRSNNINLNTLYNKINDGTLSDKRQRSIREYVEVCLKSWKHDKHIKDFEPVKLGKKVTGYSITY